MKVLMTTDTVGGVWTYAIELAGALADHDVQISLATMGRPLTTDQRMQANRLKNVRVYESEYKLEWMADPWDDLERAGRWLLRVRDQVRPDFVHLNCYGHAALPWNQPVMVVGHSCVCSWWHAVHGVVPPRQWDRYRETVTAGLQSADVIIAPTRAMARCLETFYSPPTPVRVISNGRSSKAFAPGPKHPFVISAGRMWDEAKNMTSLDRAAAGLSWPVYVAGPLEHPDRPDECHAVNVRLLGALPSLHMRMWLSRADIYALPARYEPFGLSVLEAALAGCALVLGDIESLRETWDGAAVFAPADDCDAIHAALLGLIKNPPVRRRLATAARSRALRYTSERMAGAYVDAYRQLNTSSTTLKSSREMTCASSCSTTR